MRSFVKLLSPHFGLIISTRAFWEVIRSWSWFRTSVRSRGPGQTVVAHERSSPTDWSSNVIKKIRGGNWIWQNCAKRRPSNHSADQSLGKWNHDPVSPTNVDRISVFLFSSTYLSPRPRPLVGVVVSLSFAYSLAWVFVVCRVYSVSLLRLDGSKTNSVIPLSVVMRWVF